MTKKLPVPFDMQDKIRGHVRAILHMHMGDIVRANVKLNKQIPMRIINRIEKINVAIIRDINNVLLSHRVAAADDLVSLEAIHKTLNKAEDAKVNRHLQMALPAGWHIEQGPITQKEFIVQDSVNLDDMEVYDPLSETEFVTEIDGDPNEVFRKD